MKILVTGGAGFIGSVVVDRLVEAGHKISVVDNLYSGYKENINKQANFHHVDITNFSALKGVFELEKPEFVIHSAAQVQPVYSVSHPVEDATINILGSINILECCRDFGIKKIVNICTGGALYGNPVYLPADEEHPIQPISPYGISKRAVEYYLYAYHQNFGLDYVSLRFSNVYGVHDDLKSKRVIPMFIYKFLKDESPIITGDGTQGRDFIYIDDVAEAIIKALHTTPKDKCLNIGTEKVVSINDLFHQIRNILGLKIAPTYVPERVGEVQNIYLKAQRAREQLDWAPKYDMQTGLQKTIQWFKEKYDREGLPESI
ncbi:MAG: NAD-dependent epimerase/dehydratase family protein [Promethearchaeota archaeon]